MEDKEEFEIYVNYSVGEVLDAVRRENISDGGVRMEALYGIRKNGKNKWQRKKDYKDKLKRRFLSINPGMDIQGLRGCTATRADVLLTHSDDREISFNPYVNLFVSKRGDIRKYHGKIRIKSRYYYETCGYEDRYGIRLVQRRIRRELINEDTSLSMSYLRKKFMVL